MKTQLHKFPFTILTLALFALAFTSAHAQPGVVAHWSAEGNVNDVVGTNNGTFQGGSPTFAVGYSGQAFSFDGTRYIDVPDSPAVSPTGPFTVEAYIKPNFNNFQQGIVEKYVTPGTRGFFLRIEGSGRLLFGIGGAALPTQVVTGQTPVSTGNWHHVVAIFDGSYLGIYLDEVLDAYGSAHGLLPTDGPTTLKIGARGDDVATRFNGLIDEVKMYNVALPLLPPSNEYNVADGDVDGLIAAIRAANISLGPDRINLAPNGHYVLTAIIDSDFPGPTGLPTVSGQLTVNGHGATIERSDEPGVPEFRVLYALYADVVLDSVIIKGGHSTTGGGMYLNVSTALLKNSTVADNFGNEGGGIFNSNTTLRIENSTISNNTGYGGRTGGGILNWDANAKLFISNSTLYENRADGSPGFEGRGDAIADAFSAPGSIVIKNSIIASPTRGAGDDCYAFTADSRGHNIFGDGSCGQNVAGGDLIVPNLTLEPLADNGGLTPTHALPLGSPAIDAIPLSDCTTISGAAVLTDQRGLPRPFGAGCDIGAFEQSDTTGPAITPNVSGSLGDNGWYTGDVAVNWEVSDAESAVSSSSGCDSSSVTSDTSGVTLTCTATSSGGTSTESVTIKRDATAPAITINSPTNGTYLLNQAATIDFSCSDDLSGTANCTGSAANGTALDTSSAGAGSFSVSASDNAGNTSSATVNYTVGYGVIVLSDQSKAHKSGSAVPIKIRLIDANGANVSSGSTVVHAVSVVQTSSQASTVLDDSGNSNSDFDFRYDPTLDGYIFNLKTTGYGTGTYNLNFTIGGSSNFYSVGFQVRQ